MIKKFSQTDIQNLDLKSWGSGKRLDDLPRSEISGQRIPPFDDSVKNSGIWEASPGYFVREVKEAEFMYIISGKCVFTPTEGDAIEISAGDCLFFPAETNGTWHIQEATRKLYLML